MFLNKAYYSLKPFMPWPLRLAMRRLHARYRYSACANLWPIDQKAGAIPPNWPGWPEGKRFALVLTHDVEGNRGLGRVEQLMNLELQHGFRSSFNLVPEWEYAVPDALREMLDRSGFEVGIHGLEHDGKLYNSKSGFISKAARIKQYLNLWKVAGFRSPLMQHKLAWLHRLGAEYDASTFDTDPFEPEPDGVGTIFPFWVPGPNGTGYVELPYSLPQDSTLFTILGKTNIDVWKLKLDWVAERGGMALLNTHPDYMCFNGQKLSDEFPAAFYAEFLRYAKEKYEGEFWSALPREVSRYYCANLPLAARNSRKKVCMLAYTSYESDNRVRRYAEALMKRGDQVEVIALSCGDTPLGTEQIAGVTVHRVQHRVFDERNKWTYAWRLFRFCLASSIFMMRRHRRWRYDLIHIHNMPDFLVFAAWYPKWTGAKLILDIHDIMPEMFASKFEKRSDDRYVGLLKMIEKASAKFVDHVIVSNHLWLGTLTSRSVPADKCSVFLNHVDPAIFYRRTRTRDDGKIVILFPGSFQWHQGLDIAIDAFALVKDRVQNAELHLYGGGGGDMGTELKRMAERLGLRESIKFFEGVTLDLIPEVIANADLGIVPKRADSFGNEAYSTKIMEFMSQGVPVVVSQTKIDMFYFDDKVVRFFESGNAHAMADAMVDVIEDRELREALVENGYEYADLHSWNIRKGDYLNLVDSLSTERFDEFEPSIVAAAND
jgi:glycosyltransferase involved in cell wall biosynthesis/peptidoglycan/xylan/chitin deacetylase (PgdA/CDA1 family)